MNNQDKLARAIKNMHPVHFAYLMQRIQHDTLELAEKIPAIYAKDREDTANGHFSIFHPDFYVMYVNELIRIFNQIDGTDIPLVEYENESVAGDTNVSTN